ncbi:yibQ protein [Candidatus Rhodobacter oscarellae]|uniref:YibQ protein n=2 Tax=Candidatus Rhodobacter oscarellae TaxID=1675527 RepID=A0A0J9E4A4_9RHOB|nr:yibQ protein [Candidatus Rhodobacter lobularis]
MVAPRIELSLPEPSAEEVAVPAGSEFNAERPDTDPILPQTEGRPAGEAGTLGSVDTGLSAPSVDTSPVATPQAMQVEADISSPSSEGGSTAGLNVSGEEGVVSLPGTAQPSEPGLETTPTQVDAPLATPAAPTPETVTAPSAGPTETAPEISAPSDPALETDLAASATAPALEPAPATAESAEAPVAADGPGRIVAPDLSVDAPNLPTTADASISAPSFGAIASNAAEDSLPNIGAGPETPAEVEAAPALLRYAAPFEPENDTPRLAIVLIDDGVAALDGLADLPLPVAVAVDPLDDGAAGRMAALRAAGVEVLVLTPLPKGAAPADVEVAFQSYFTAVPQAVAVMDLPQAVLQESRPRAVQVVEILKETGHGLVTYNKGLNAALRIAEREGVAAAKLSRVFDDGSTDAGGMRRALNQGVFRSGQEKAAVLVGQLRPEALAVLAEWSFGSRARQVTLAPVSAVLRGD